MSDEVAIRSARANDAASLADAWSEFGRYYAALDPVLFRVPEEVEEWVESDLKAEHAGRQLLRDVGEPVLNVHALLVVEDQRRMGVGTELMRAVEDWARSRGATRAFLNTYSESFRSPVLRATDGLPVEDCGVLEAALGASRRFDFEAFETPDEHRLPCVHA